MTLHLRPGVHAAIVGDDLALLDIIDDAYFCLVGGALGFRATDRRAEPGSPVAAALAEAGLLGPEPSRTARTAPALPRRSLVHDRPMRRSGPADIFALAAATLEVRRARARGGLGAYLALADGARPPAGHSLAVEAAAGVFRTLSPWAAIEGECLVRSALLVRFLRRRGLAADWVFGVRLWPFSAHCWVQSGDASLNDDFERLRAYTPLFVA